MAAPDMSCFISIMPFAGFSESPPESKVMPLPTMQMGPPAFFVPRPFAAPRPLGAPRPFGRCSSTISRGGAALP